MALVKSNFVDIITMVRHHESTWPVKFSVLAAAHYELDKISFAIAKVIYVIQ